MTLLHDNKEKLFLMNSREQNIKYHTVGLDVSMLQKTSPHIVSNTQNQYV